MRLPRFTLCIPLLGLSCGKVPLVDVNAGFDIADVTWFEEEQTLFVFHEVFADQGITENSVIEIRYTIDDVRQDWTDIQAFEKVHTHVPVDCGARRWCGSTSFHVPTVPRDVQLRLRYHREGALDLRADTVYNVVETGDPHSHRSMVVYGVFDETNTRVQWRGRHTFPTLRNHHVQELGLRRDLVIDEQAYGAVGLASAQNPYSYGQPCSSLLTPLDLPPLETDERAKFNEDPLPEDAASANGVCSAATVTDALGTFTTSAFARKNPEVRGAFPELRTPVREATMLPFFLGPCEREFDPEHEEMQRQRLLIEDLPTTCTEGWQRPDFADDLVLLFREAIRDARPAGNDMVLAIALHRDEPELAGIVEAALLEVLPDERLRASPRVAGGFVFDSDIRGLDEDLLSQSTLWCPSTIPIADIPDASQRTCAVQPNNPGLNLGPLTFNTVPILPGRQQYANFIEDFGAGQAGEVEALTFKAPEFATTTDPIDLGEFGVVTFLNGELISADADDAFSYCFDETPQLFAYRSPTLELFGVADVLENLPAWHNENRESTYDLGIFWEFPFLMQLDYRSVVAGAVSAGGFSVPFGIGSNEVGYYGTEMWTEDTFSIPLTQCTRFCEHPTFGPAGVYHVTDPFRSTYETLCYEPTYPLFDEGFPLDP